MESTVPETPNIAWKNVGSSEYEKGAILSVIFKAE
jgi:hypothetical protein